MNSVVLSSVAESVCHLLMSEPFFGQWLATIPRKITNQINDITICFSESYTFEIWINENYWGNTLVGNSEETTLDIRVGALKSQLLHLIFLHPIRGFYFQNKNIFSIAADLSINQFLEKNQLSKNAVTLEDLNFLDLEKGKDLNFYYKKIFKDRMHPQLQLLIANKKLTSATYHFWWKNFSKKTFLENQLYHFVFDFLNRSSEKNNFENYPFSDFFKQRLKTIFEEITPKINWQKILRQFVFSNTFTFQKNTIHRPSKRYGTTPGTKIRPRQKFIVAIDTSASVSEIGIQKFFAEIHQIWRRGTEIFMLECDTRIRQQYFYEGVLPKKIHGRGGTDFSAAIEFSNEKFRANGLIYFTDGKGFSPRVKSRVPLLWVIFGNENSENELEGKKIYLQ